MNKEYSGIGNLKLGTLTIPVEYSLVVDKSQKGFNTIWVQQVSVIENDIQSKNALANSRETLTLVLDDGREVEIILTSRDPVGNIFSGKSSGATGDMGSFL